MKQYIAELQESLPPLTWDLPNNPLPQARMYATFYDLHVPRCEHRLGVMQIGEYRIAVQVFEPIAPQYAVLLVHGYLDHVGMWRRAIHSLVKSGFLVVAYDHPGHGLSSGTRADIDDFRTYSAILSAVHNNCRQNRPGLRWDLLAHSMGGAVVIDYLLRPNTTLPDSDKESPESATGVGYSTISAPSGTCRDAQCEVTLLAPLCHSAIWSLSGAGQRLMHRFRRTVPRAYRRNSSDKDFLAFVRQDPLHVDSIPLHWFIALRVWNTRLTSFPTSPLHIAIIQGDADHTVDWKYNIPLIQRHFPKADVIIVPGARHQLMNESHALRSVVMNHILSRHMGKPAASTPTQR